MTTLNVTFLSSSSLQVWSEACCCPWLSLPSAGGRRERKTSGTIRSSETQQLDTSAKVQKGRGLNTRHRGGNPSCDRQQHAGLQYVLSQTNTEGLPEKETNNVCINITEEKNKCNILLQDNVLYFFFFFTPTPPPKNEVQPVRLTRESQLKKVLELRQVKLAYSGEVTCREMEQIQVRLN